MKNATVSVVSDVAQISLWQQPYPLNGATRYWTSKVRLSPVADDFSSGVEVEFSTKSRSLGIARMQEIVDQVERGHAVGKVLGDKHENCNSWSGRIHLTDDAEQADLARAARKENAAERADEHDEIGRVA